MNSFLPKAISKIVSLIFLLTAFLSTQPLLAQVRFSSTCPETTIGKNDLLQIQFKIENAKEVESIIPPSFKNFTVVSGPNQQSGMTNINGKVNQYIAISFFLKPKAAGRFTIGAAEARADGKAIFSNKISVEVLNSTSPPSPGSQSGLSSPFSNFNFDPAPQRSFQFDDYILKKGENAEEKIKKNLFVKLEVNKKNCYVGEAITASYKLYTRLRSESTITEAPSFNGFSVSDLEVDDNVNIEKYNGRKYNVYTLRKVQLYPMQDGKISLGPLVANNKVSFLKSEYANRQHGDRFFDMFEDFADATTPQDGLVDETVSLKSDPVIVDVKPLPATNIPDNFKGAVGKYTLSSSLKKNKITTDDEGVLQVVISGEGNIQMINAPVIKWPEGVDGFEARVQESVDKSAVPMKGTKTFSFPFLINQPGDFSLDSVTFSYFDLSTNSYEIKKSPPLSLHVTKGNGTAKGRLAKMNQQKDEREKSFIEKFSLPIIGGVALVFLIALLANFYGRKKKKEIKTVNIKEETTAENSERSEGPQFIVPENPLLSAHEKLIAEDSAGFYRVLDASMKKHMATKFKIPLEEMSKKRLNEELDRCNVGLSTCLMLNSLQEEIELNLYSRPSTPNQLKNVFEKASQVVSLLDKQCGTQSV